MIVDFHPELTRVWSEPQGIIVFAVVERDRSHVAMLPKCGIIGVAPRLECKQSAAIACPEIERFEKKLAKVASSKESDFARS
jgi:hypothetical protein